MPTLRDFGNCAVHMVAHYRTGSRSIPKTVWLACKGWEALRRAA